MPIRRRNVLLFALAFAALPAPSRAQVPAPSITDINKRSGLVGRWTPIESNLPPDKKRDSWYTTRWGDPPNIRAHPKLYFNGGLYGLPWKVKDTRSVYPYFFGSPGADTITADSRPSGPVQSLTRRFVHPYKPVGMYYDQGSYVPIYDPRPFVPGPGAWPWPFFQSSTHGGG